MGPGFRFAVVTDYGVLPLCFMSVTFAGVTSGGGFACNSYQCAGLGNTHSIDQ